MSKQQQTDLEYAKETLLPFYLNMINEHMRHKWREVAGEETWHKFINFRVNKLAEVGYYIEPAELGKMAEEFDYRGYNAGALL